MRRAGRAVLSLLVLMTGPVAIVLAASPASAGFTPRLTVTKIVEGTPPPGAEWVVEVTCDGESGPPREVTFTEPGSETLTIIGDGTCTVVETVTAGATVTYACEVKVNPENAECTGDNQVTYTEGSPFPEATVTVTNTYAPPAPPSPPEPAAPPAAAPVTAGARFTG